MQVDNLFYMIIYFIVTVVVAWIAFSLILLWIKPAFYTAGGAVNWGVTFWVALIVILLAWLMMIILYWLVKLIVGRKCKPKCKPAHCDPCVQPDPCAQPDPCDPCAKPKNTNNGYQMWRK